jgi:hypothetical protein
MTPKSSDSTAVSCLCVNTAYNKCPLHWMMDTIQSTDMMMMMKKMMKMMMMMVMVMMLMMTYRYIFILYLFTYNVLEYK